VIQRLAGTFRRLAAELATAGGFDDTVSTVLREAGGPAEADLVVLALPEVGGRRLRVFAGSADARRAFSGWNGVGIDVRHPLVDALREMRPVVIAGGEGFAEYPGPARDVEDLGMRSVALYPLGTSGGPLGVIGFLWRRRKRLGRSQRESLRITADLCGLALERARLRMFEHQFVAELRGELLESPGLLGGSVEVAGGYEPAWAGVPLGGDWYDAVETPEGRVSVAVGDVAGHGVRSAPEMIAARQILRDLMADGADPVACLQGLDARVVRRYSEHPPAVISVLVATIDPAAGVLRLANGGLPSPWIWAPGDTARPIDEGRERVVGTGEGFGPRPGLTVRLEPGSVFVAYTDGLQAGRADTPAALATELREVVAALGTDPLDGLVGRLLQREAGARLRADDTVVLAVRLSA